MVEILCIGNAMVDLFVLLDGEDPAALGLSAPVQHVRGEKLAEILSALPVPPVTVSGGGAANVAKIASLLGIPTAFAGSIGNTGDPYDPYAEVFEKELTEAGVLPLLVRDAVPTGLCLILEKRGGDRIIAACPQAALHFSAWDLPEDRIREAKVVVLDGYLLGRDTLVHRVLDLAHKYGTPVAMDVGSAFIAASRAAEIARYCRDYPLILFMNEEEAAAFCRALMNEGNAVGQGSKPSVQDAPLVQGVPPAVPHKQSLRDEMHYIVEFLTKMTANDIFPIIAVKRGKRGAAVFAGGHIYPASAIAVSSAETTGAGDAFCAGFLAGWIRGRPIADCAALGNKTARTVLDSPGVRVDRKKLAGLVKSLT
jgi:sugar/nucleoside kinase (ribokinase family)